MEGCEEMEEEVEEEEFKMRERRVGEGQQNNSNSKMTDDRNCMNTPKWLVL